MHPGTSTGWYRSWILRKHIDTNTCSCTVVISWRLLLGSSCSSVYYRSFPDKPDCNMILNLPKFSIHRSYEGGEFVVCKVDGWLEHNERKFLLHPWGEWYLPTWEVFYTLSLVMYNVMHKLSTFTFPGYVVASGLHLISLMVLCCVSVKRFRSAFNFFLEFHSFMFTLITSI